jgi:ADP-heptose:LPS heptosyltransferase
MKKRYPHKKKILLVNITRLGDMLQATPTIAGLKEENPGCHITVLVEKQFEEVCTVIPHIDKIVGLDLAMVCRCLDREREGIIDAYEYLSEFVEKLRVEQFDYCLNMSSSAYTALLLRLIGVSQNGGWTADEEGNRVIESEWARLFATSVFHQNRQFNSLNLVDVFRCSADVEAHPRQLLINVEDASIAHCEKLLAEAPFTNTGPLITVQAGASQGKRQWAPERFVKMISILVNKYNARVVLTGASKERPIIDPIVQGCNSPNVISVAGRTNVPQLSAMLKLSKVLVTGDTGPMHISVAVGTPVVAMFLASAFGFETGPYSEGNIILQPIIGCGPCNPNKACGRPDCHDQISPELVAALTMQRVEGEVFSVDPQVADPRSVTVYRSVFDENGFCDLVAINTENRDPLERHRRTYRKLWLDDLGELPLPKEKGRSMLTLQPEPVEGLEDVKACAVKGQRLLTELVEYVKDATAPAAKLGAVNKEIVELDREIEQLGFHHAAMAPITRMFVFAKENLQGSDPLDLASQMKSIYRDLERRADKYQLFYSNS